MRRRSTLARLQRPGKVFGGTAVKAGGADFSLQVFAPGTEGGFYHTHKEHEELYFFLSGEGEYQVDGTNIPVKEGSVVRVSPAGKRAVRNTGSTPLTMRSGKVVVESDKGKGTKEVRS